MRTRLPTCVLMSTTANAAGWGKAWRRGSPRCLRTRGEQRWQSGMRGPR